MTISEQIFFFEVFDMNSKIKNLFGVPLTGS